jgi:hypothetical protein
MDTDHTRSLTYAEMASLMAITIASAKNLTRRKRWPRQRGNDGLVKVLVPLDHLEGNGSGEGRHDGPHDGLDGGRQDALVTIAALERHVARLEASLEAAEKALAEARSEADAARAKVLAEAVTTAALRATLEAVSAERDRLADQVKAALARHATVPSISHVASAPSQRRWWPFRRRA